MKGKPTPKQMLGSKSNQSQYEDVTSTNFQSNPSPQAEENFPEFRESDEQDQEPEKDLRSNTTGSQSSTGKSGDSSSHQKQEQSKDAMGKFQQLGRDPETTYKQFRELRVRYNGGTILIKPDYKKRKQKEKEHFMDIDKPIEKIMGITIR